MKRYFISFCFLIIALISNIAVAHAQSNSLPDLEKLSEKRADYLEIVNLEEEIIGMLNDFRQYTKNERLPDDFKISFDSAKKIYVDADIFSIETSEKQEIKKELKKSTYMWLLLINIGADTYQIHIAKGLPLDDAIADKLTTEEIQRIKDAEGKWIV